ncbi:MAG: deoxyribose-phosphate aldolase [Bacteroidales bacterium]|nr:deoxyribose-phosphate aldolase [Bacteroidales bacterium]
MIQVNKYQEVYGSGENDSQVELRTHEILLMTPKVPSRELLKKLFSFIDLTTLNTHDNTATAQRFCSKLNTFSETFPDIPTVAAICIYPALLEAVKENLQDKSVNIAAVGAGFPSSQTFLSVKNAECKLLVSKGANEIDIVISAGQFLAGEYQQVFDEISSIKSTIEDVHLKVILETGLLKTAKNIRIASLIAMEAGADFIKTSTGKLSPAATPEAVYIMASAIRDYHTVTGRMIGLKPAGGISNVDDAARYYTLIEQILGENWTSPEYFRLGASRLSNNILSAISGNDISFF